MRRSLPLLGLFASSLLLVSGCGSISWSQMPWQSNNPETVGNDSLSQARPKQPASNESATQEQYEAQQVSFETAIDEPQKADDSKKSSGGLNRVFNWPTNVLSRGPAKPVGTREWMLGCELNPTEADLVVLRSMEHLELAKKYRSALLLAQQHPDVILRLQRSQWLDSKHRSKASETIAVALDQRAGRNSNAWLKLLQESNAKSDVAQRYQQQRGLILISAAEGKGNASRYTELQSITTEFEHPFPMIDALWLEAAWQIDKRRFDRAAKRLMEAIELCDKLQDANLGSELRLRLCAVLSSNRRAQDARMAWEDAVNLQLLVLSNQENGLSISFWQEAIRLRPEGERIPPQLMNLTLKNLSRVGPSGIWQAQSSVDSEADLMVALGDQAWQQGQPQHAETLFLQAKDLRPNHVTTAWLELAIARCQLAQGRTEEAANRLGALLESNDPAIAAASRSLLGSLRIQLGVYDHGVQMIESALQSSSAEWPGRLAAEADLALVYLISGRTNEGQNLLQQVRAQLQQRQEWASLIQSYENELRWRQKQRQTEAVAALNQTILELERR